MLVIHGVWRSDSHHLQLWAEDSTLPTHAPRRPGRPPRERPHPYAADEPVLAAVLGEAADKAVTGSAVLELPTRTGGPLASPELVRTEDTNRATGPVTLVRWRVPTLAYEPDTALSLLTDLSRDGGAVTLGAGLRHLVELAGFAVDLVARGRVLPGVVAPTAPGAAGAVAPGTAAFGTSGRGEARARAGGVTRSTDQVAAQALWRPVITGADVQWARALALALPPSVRAAMPDVPAATLVADLLDALTDAAARTVLDGIPLTDEPPRRGALAADAWLRALTGPRRDFTAPAAAIESLRIELDAWQRDATGGAVRASFRLVEPTPLGEDTWWVAFALQSTEAAGAPVEAAEIWSADTSGGAVGGRSAPAAPAGPTGAHRPAGLDGDAAQETLLAELGRASRLWPELDRALRVATPEGLPLDTEGAHRFLREGAPILHAAGFNVLLPSWWQRPAGRLGARLTARSRTAPGTVAGGTRIGRSALLDYQWELSLGDQVLTADELAELARRKSPLIRLRGQWVELDPRRLAAGLRLLRRQGELTVTDLLQLALTAEDEPDALPVLGVSADGPLGDLLAGQAERHLTPRAAPPGFAGTLRPYQQRGLAWLSFLESLGLGGILADDMGLGKTVQLLALLVGDAPDSGPTLLVCPMSLVGNWQREAARFAPQVRVYVHHGPDRARDEVFAAAAAQADLVLTTYSVAARDTATLAAVDWHRIVADEAQAIKNAATRQAEAVRTLSARNRIAVTGTPVENRLADLWSIMEFVNPGLLGPAATFRRRYAEPVERHGDEEAAGRLRRMTGPFVLRRLKTDPTVISDLPEKLEMDVLCNLTAEQASLYQAVVDDMLARIETSDGIERRGLVLATMTKLKQVCNHPAHLLRDGSALPGRSGKLARLEEILDEVLAAGEKSLLFTQYAEFGGMLHAHLSARFGREVLHLHGGVGKAARDDLVARFQTPAGPPLFVLSLKAGGTGLTLTEANHVVHVDRWWNPAVEDQATDRAFRIGQRRQVQVRKFVCAGTVEEKVAAMIVEKRGLAARVVGTGEQWLTELSTSQLRDLFALEAGAVAE